ncbi:MAG: hypothetical protein R3178_03055, partial [Rhodothermales bacterium]|nr:hypothetical protein [Rhodothermales bacterium]
LQAFNILLQIGAGTGLLFILRWFWWRINPWSEITAMVVSFLVAVYFQFVHTSLGLTEVSSHLQLLIGVAITTVAWVSVTFATSPSTDEKLFSFYNLVSPGGPGWREVLQRAERGGVELKGAGAAWEVPVEILCMLLGAFMVYGTLFSVGFLVYGNYTPGASLAVVALIAGVLLARFWKKLKAS